MRGMRTVWSAVFVVLVGCGGSQPPVESPEPPVEEAAEPEPPPAPKPKADEEKAEEPEAQPDENAQAKPAVEPDFKDGMSVNEAINAVPQGAERLNIDPDSLGKPLMNPDLYKPCKLSPRQHVKIRVAIWQGKAVGIDVTPSPKNKKAANCVKEQIKTLTWKDKVPSLNTVDYAL